MVEAETDNDPVRKQKFPANLTKENGNKNIVVFPLLVLSFFSLMHLCVFMICSILNVLMVKCHVVSC